MEQKYGNNKKELEKVQTFKNRSLKKILGIY